MPPPSGLEEGRRRRRREEGDETPYGEFERPVRLTHSQMDDKNNKCGNCKERSVTEDESTNFLMATSYARFLEEQQRMMRNQQPTTEEKSIS